MKFALNLHFGYYFLNLLPSHLSCLARKFPDVEFVDLEKNDDRFAEVICDSEAVATWPFDLKRFNDLFGKAEKLRWIQFSYVGVASDYLLLAREKKWIVTNARGLASESLANHALGLILSFERKLPMAFGFQKERRWDHKAFMETPYGFDGIRGKLLGIVGVGSIGTALAKKASALGMRVWGIRKQTKKKPACVEKVFPLSKMDEVLSESDFVVLCLPLLPETAGVFGEAQLRKMKKSAYLVNIARGDLLEEKALMKALQGGWIAGAALDVVSTEPLPKEHPLYDTPNLILTPHIAGLDRRYTDLLVDLIAENTRRYLAGKMLLNEVDLIRGY